MTEERWIFDIDISKKPGVLNSVTGVFTNWGISIETTMMNAYGPDGTNGKIILSFACSSRKMQILKRTVSRLSKVIDLKSYPYQTQELRMIAACRVPPGYRVEGNEHVEVEYAKIHKDKQIVYISGSVADVDACLKPMIERKEILEMVNTILSV